MPAQLTASDAPSLGKSEPERTYDYCFKVPCPVCHRTGLCTRWRNGAVLCATVQSEHAIPRIGSWHLLPEFSDYDRLGNPRFPEWRGIHETPAENWRAWSRDYFDDFTRWPKAELAQVTGSLRTTGGTLNALQAGVLDDVVALPMWTRPVWDYYGTEDVPCGFMGYDLQSGTVKIVEDTVLDGLGVAIGPPSQLGVLRADGEGATLVCDGLLDTVAASTLGHPVIGATAGNQQELIVSWCYRTRDVVVLVKDEAGVKLAQRLVTLLREQAQAVAKRQQVRGETLVIYTENNGPVASVRIVRVEQGLHAWLLKNAKHDDVQKDIKALRQQLAQLIDAVQPVFTVVRGFALREWVDAAPTRAEKLELIEWEEAREQARERKRIEELKQWDLVLEGQR